jgi:lipopolysaccharide assembly protein A
MRTLCMFFLILFLAAVGAFALFNHEEVVLRFFDWSLTTNLAVLTGATYLLGMLSGWTVVGMIRKSIHRVTDRPFPVERELGSGS